MMLPAIDGAFEANLSVDPGIHDHSYEPIQPFHDSHLGNPIVA
jgi:hypothetical protein